MKRFANIALWLCAIVFFALWVWLCVKVADGGNRYGLSRASKYNWHVIFTDEQSVADGLCGVNVDSTVYVWDMAEASGNLTDECLSQVLTADGNPAYEATGPEGAGSAVTLDGTGDWFDTAGVDVAGLDVTDGEQIAIDVWARATSSSAVLLVEKRNGSNAGYRLQVDVAGQGRFAFEDDAANECAADTGATDLRDNAWHHYRATWNGTNICAIIIDGVETDTTTVAADSGDNANQFIIGATSAEGSPWFGDIAHVRVCTGTSAIADCPSMIQTGETLPYSAGDAFTRATGSTRYSEQVQRQEAVVSGVPVIGSPLVTCASCVEERVLPSAGDPKGLYLGGAVTVRALHNEDYTNAVWTDGVGTPAQSADACTAVAPNGFGTADTIADNDAGAIERLDQSVASITATEPVAACGWFSNEATAAPDLIIDGTSTDCRVVDGTWEYCCATDSSASGTSVTVSIEPDGADAGDTGTICAWRVQVFQGFVNKAVLRQVPMVATTTAAVTVNADAMTYSVNPGSWDTGTACGWVHLGEGDMDTTQGIYVVDGTADLRLSIGTTEQIGFQTFGLADNASVVSAASQVDGETWEFVCARWRQSESEVDLFLDGALNCGASGTACDTADDAWTASGSYGTTLTLSHTADTDVDDPLWGWLSYGAVWKSKWLSDAEIARIDNITGNIGGFVMNSDEIPDVMYAQAERFERRHGLPELFTGLWSRGAKAPPRPTWSRTFQNEDDPDEEIPWNELFEERNW